jgi:hypothetical protein
MKLWFWVPRRYCRGHRSNACCAVRLGNLLSKFRRNVPPSSSDLCFNSRPHNPVEEAVNAPSKRREATTPTTRCNNPEFLFRYENRFATNKILQPSVISIGYSGNLPATLAVSFPAVCSLSLVLQRRQCYLLLLWLYLHLNGGCGEYSTLISKSLPPSSPYLSLYLFLSHASSGKVKSEYSSTVAFKQWAAQILYNKS